ncbi:MAG: response regulator transcription factor [Acidobacteriales bacterium]|nr:response regulator transcription factor [Terriglobales bacterium]
MNSPSNSETAEKLRVYLVESDPLRVVGYRSLLEGQHEMRVEVGGPDGLAGAHFDVALLSAHSDLEMFDLIATSKASHPEKRALVVGPRVSDDLVLQAITAGAKGYVEESASASSIAEAIRVVHGGSMWAPRRVLATFVERAMISEKDKVTFTDRERSVLKLLVAGRSNKEIGTELNIEERTVKAHVAKLMKKVGAPNRIALSVHAVTRSLLK